MFRYIVAAVVAGLLVFFWLFLLPYFQQVTCPACAGKGIVQRGIVEIPCPYCKGRGRIAPYARDIVLAELEKQKKADQEEMKKEAATATAIASESPSENQPAQYQSEPAPN